MQVGDYIISELTDRFIVFTKYEKLILKKALKKTVS